MQAIFFENFYKAIFLRLNVKSPLEWKGGNLGRAVPTRQIGASTPHEMPALF